MSSDAIFHGNVHFFARTRMNSYARRRTKVCAYARIIIVPRSFLREHRSGLGIYYIRSSQPIQLATCVWGGGLVSVFLVRRANP